MENAEHASGKVPNNKGKGKVRQIKKKIDELEDRLAERVRELRRDLEAIEQANLISPARAAEILDISVEAVRKRAARGTLTKRNADGSKKITNRKTEIFFDEQEVRNKI